MKQKTLLLIIAMGTYSLFAQESSSSAKYLRTESNGVQIYEASETHTKLNTSLESAKVRSIEEWSLEECQNSLYYVDLKIEKSKESDSEIERAQLELYNIQKSAINSRIKQLSNSTY